jgi:hypothetical protein
MRRRSGDGPRVHGDGGRFAKRPMVSQGATARRNNRPVAHPISVYPREPAQACPRVRGGESVRRDRHRRFYPSRGAFERKDTP